MAQLHMFVILLICNAQKLNIIKNDSHTTIYYELFDKIVDFGES